MKLKRRVAKLRVTKKREKPLKKVLIKRRVKKLEGFRHVRLNGYHVMDKTIIGREVLRSLLGDWQFMSAEAIRKVFNDLDSFLRECGLKNKSFTNTLKFINREDKTQDELVAIVWNAVLRDEGFMVEIPRTRMISASNEEFEVRKSSSYLKKRKR